jgi:hypothetical protein
MGSSAKNYFNGDVGIGTASPQAKLDVNGTVEFDDLVRWEHPDKALDTTTSTLGYMRLYDEAGAYCGLGVSTSNFNIGSSGLINVRTVVNAQDRLILRTDGSNTLYYGDGQELDITKSTDTADGLRLGDIYGNNTAYQGLSHASFTSNSSYMIMSEGTSTLISADTGGSVFIRGGPNYSTNEIRLYPDSNGVVVNEQGRNSDFRVEGDSDPYLLFADASTDRIGIGTSLPQMKLDVDGTFRANDVVTLGSGSIPLPRKPIELLNPTNISELTINEQFTFPTTDGSSGQGLITDGLGDLSWNNVIISDTTAASGSDVINNIISLTQEEYDAITPQSGTLYAISSSGVIGGGGTVLNETVNGRLTLESGEPVSTTNQIAKTTLYFTPYKGNQIALYDGTAWGIHSFSELSLSLSGYTADTNYDIFIYDNSGTLTLESAAWTNNTTRATALVLQDGVYVKSGATTRRYIGTIRTTNTAGQCEDSQPKRFVWNYYNKVSRRLDDEVAYSNWTYTTDTWRVLSGTASKVEIVCGIREDLLDICQEVFASTNASPYYSLGISVNGSADPDLLLGVSRFNDSAAGVASTGQSTMRTKGSIIPRLGYSYYNGLERNSLASSISISVGTISGNLFTGGMKGEWKC